MPDAPATARPRVTRFLPALLLLLTVFGPISMDLYLPALPALTAELGAATSIAQLTVTACLAGLAAGQLIAGPLSDRIGGRPFLVSGLALQAIGLAWMAALISPHISYLALVATFVCCGLGMALFFIPVANVVMGAVPAADQGMASGTNNAIRELGGVLGIAVLATVFASHGSYVSPATFADGLRPAMWVGAAVVGIGALAAAAIPRRRRAASVGDKPLTEVMSAA